MTRKKRWRGDDSSEFSDDEDLEAFRSANESRMRLNAYKIKRLKHNHPDSKHVSFGGEFEFSSKAWERLGGYVAQNEHVECVSLRRCDMNDDDASAFFRGASARRNGRTKVLTLYGNSFGSGGMRGLVPFLKSAFGLASLNVSGNDIRTEGFRWLANGLDGGSIEKLNLRHCGLTNVAVLERISLSNLQVLYLSDNGDIGADGCRSVGALLRRGGSRLKKLYVNRCNIGDEGTETIAESLAVNESLTHIELEGNGIGGRGRLALLRLVNDVSSVEATYDSNHRLRLIDLEGNATGAAAAPSYDAHVQEAIEINRRHHHNGGDLAGGDGAGRAKVIRYHLDSDARARISALQGVADRFMRPYAELDSAILPDVVSLLVGRRSGLSDAYRLLLARCSELGFGVRGSEEGQRAPRERIAELEAIVAEQGRRIGSLTASNLELRTRLASISHFAKKIQSNIETVERCDEGETSNRCGRKRPWRGDDL